MLKGICKMNELKEKLYKNSLIVDRLTKLTKEERSTVLKELLKEKSQRQLASELHIPHSTLHDWVSNRQLNVGAGCHVSLSLMYRKLSNMHPQDITDWGRIEQIRDVCETLLRRKEF